MSAVWEVFKVDKDDETKAICGLCPDAKYTWKESELNFKSNDTLW